MITQHTRLTQHENSVPSMLSYRALTVYIYRLKTNDIVK